MKNGTKFLFIMIVVFSICYLAIPRMFTIKRAEEEELKRRAVKEYKLNYFQDKRTGLCFAAIGFTINHSSSIIAGNYESHHIMLSNVPCTDKVLTLIEFEKDEN